MGLRAYQKNAILTMIKQDRYLLIAPTGSGKSVMAVGLYAALKLKTLVIVPTSQLVTQMIGSFEKFTGIKPEKFENKKRNGNDAQVVVSTWQSMTRAVHDGYVPAVDMIIGDECFVAGTMVDDKKIEDVKIGDFVRSYNEIKKIIEYKKVKKIYKSKPKTLMTITFDNGIILTCTENHSFYVNGVWTLAKNMKVYDTVLSTIKGFKNNKKRKSDLFSLSKKLFVGRKIFTQSKFKKKKILFRKMQRKTGKNKQCWLCATFGRIQSQVCFGKNEKKESYVFYENKSKSKHKIKSYRLEAANTRRKRTRSYCPSIIVSVCSWLGNGIYCLHKKTNKKQKRKISNKLQNRCCQWFLKSCYRSRWFQSLFFVGKEKRQEKRRVFDIKRVESVTFHKYGDNEEFIKLCPKGFVYNLEVEDNHNYFAHNILVHNCHKIGEETLYMDIIRKINPARFYAVTATPFRYDDILPLKQLCNNNEHKINIEDLYAGKYLMRPNISFIETGFSYDIDALLKAWEKEAYGFEIKIGKLKAEIGKDEARNKMIIDSVIKHKGKFNLVLSYTTSQTDWFYENYIDTMFTKKLLIHGKLTKKEKTVFFEDIESCENDFIIFATQSFLGEGIDIPKLDTLFLTTPFGGGAKAIQFAGRILRPCSGKTEVNIYDFNDTFNGIGKHWKFARKQKYDLLLPRYKQAITLYPQLGNPSLLNSPLTLVKIEYTKLLARYYKAKDYLNSPNRKEEDKVKWSPKYQEIVTALVVMLNKIDHYTVDQVSNGWPELVEAMKNKE